MHSCLLEGYGKFLSVQNKALNRDLNEQDETAVDLEKLVMKNLLDSDYSTPCWFVFCAVDE